MTDAPDQGVTELIYIYISDVCKKRGPPQKKDTIFQNGFGTKKSLETQSSYIWWFPKGWRVPEIHWFAGFSYICKHLILHVNYNTNTVSRFPSGW